MNARRRPTRAESPHVHDDVDVSASRLHAFVHDDLAAQRAALATLRARAADDDAHLLLSFAGILIAVLIATIVPPVVIGKDVPWWAIGVISVVAGLVVGAVFLPLMIPIIRTSKRRQTAVVWIAAYEDELDRWRALPGRAGRRWRRSH